MLPTFLSLRNPFIKQITKELDKMNNIETFAVKQTKYATVREKITRDLRRAISVINAEYQQIDWEDAAFLNGVLNEAIENLEGLEEISNVFN